MGLGDILKGLGGIAGLIPGIGTAIGTGLNLAGSAVGGLGGGSKGGGEAGGGGGSSLLELAMPGMVQGGFGLLGALASGKQQEKAQKQAFELWEKKGKIQEERINKYLKPELPRYNIEKDLGNIDPAFKKIILGRLTDALGGAQLSKWGVDPAALLASIGQGGGGVSPAPSGGGFPSPGTPPGAPRVSMANPNDIMQKYGMMPRGKMVGSEV